MNAVSFSEDRLRVLTCSDDGTAKVWDTTFLAATRNASERVVAPKEITTLKYHTQSVKTVKFSPDGQHILTSSLDGTAVLWLGLPMAPAIRLSKQPVEYPSGAGPQTIDDQAIFSSPSRLDLDQSKLTISWVETNDPADQFTIVANGDARRAIALRDNEILYRVNDKEQVVAQVEGGSDSLPLVITFAEAADRLAVELVMRSVAFEHRAVVASDSNRTVQFDFRLRGGECGNFEAESKTIHLHSP